MLATESDNISGLQLVDSETECLSNLGHDRDSSGINPRVTHRARADELRRQGRAARSQRTISAMVNKERPEEIEARAIVERITGISWEHHDANGAADYITSDHSTAAMEVTTVTNQELKGSVAMLARLRNTPYPDSRLDCCWSMTIDEQHRALKGIESRVANAIAGLQLHGISSVNEWEWATYIWGGHAAGGTVALLAQDSVQAAYRSPELCAAMSTHSTHYIVFMSSGGGSASGSEASLSLILTELLGREDNFKKLRAESVDQRHLFVWLDDQTDFAVARPLDRQDDSRWDHFGLPNSPPELPDVDQLWIVHRLSRRGWHWTGHLWEAVDAEA